MRKFKYIIKPTIGNKSPFNWLLVITSTLPLFDQRSPCVMYSQIAVMLGHLIPKALKYIDFCSRLTGLAIR